MRFIFLISFLLLASCSQLQNKEVSREFNFKKKWARSTLQTDYLGYKRLHRMPPLVTKDLVIVSNAVDGMVAYDRKRAYKVWTFKVKGGVEAGAELVGDNLFFGASDGHFYSLNVLNGKINWSFPIRSEGLSKPLVNQGVVYFIAGNNVAYALNSSNGQKIWLYNRLDSTNLSIRGGSQPAAYGNKIILGFSDGFVVALNINTGQMAWEKPLNSNKRFRDVDSSPTVENDRIYVASFDDSLYCLNVKDGSEIWKVNEGGFYAITLFEDSLFYSTSTGKLLALDKKSGKELWSRELKHGMGTKPTVHKGLLIIGETEGSLKALDTKTGDLIGEYKSGAGISSEVVIKDFNDGFGNVYFLTKQANLFVLDMGWRNKENWKWLTY